MADKYVHDLIQTGDHYEAHESPAMPGHYATAETPVRCKCCGQDSYHRGAKCLCRHVQRWYQDELRNVSCELHLQEKVKDGLFRV